MELSKDERMKRLGIYANLGSEFGLYSNTALEYVKGQTDEKLLTLIRAYRINIISFSELFDYDIGAIEDVKLYKKEYSMVSKTMNAINDKFDEIDSEEKELF